MYVDCCLVDKISSNTCLAQSISWLYVQVCFCKLTRFPFLKESLAWITTENKVSLLYIRSQEQHVYVSCSMIIYGVFIERIFALNHIKGKFYFHSHLLLFCFSFFFQSRPYSWIYLFRLAGYTWNCEGKKQKSKHPNAFSAVCLIRKD